MKHYRFIDLIQLLLSQARKFKQQRKSDQSGK